MNARSLLLFCLFFGLVSFSFASTEALDKLIKDKAYTEALEQIDARLEKKAPSQALLYRKALCLYHLNELRQARDIAGKLIKIAPQEPACFDLLGSIYLKGHIYSEAMMNLYRSLLLRQKAGAADSPEVWVNLSYAMRLFSYFHPSPRIIKSLPRYFKDSPGKDFLLTEFDASLFNSQSRSVSPIHEFISKYPIDGLHSAYVERLALLARQSSDYELDLRILQELVRRFPEEKSYRDAVSRLQSAVSLSQRLKAIPPTRKAATTEAPPSLESTQIPDLPESPILDEPKVTEPEKNPLFYLPFPAGSLHFCAQGFNGLYSHQGRVKFACDFYVKPATPILAARSGYVYLVHRDMDIEKYEDDFASWIIISHGDGLYSRYFHLDGRSILVKPGQRVLRGQQIASAGHTARTLCPILHFDVARKAFWKPRQVEPYKTWKSVAVKFYDLSHMLEEAGAPLTGRWYVSKNKMLK